MGKKTKDPFDMTDEEYRLNERIKEGMRDPSSSNAINLRTYAPGPRYYKEWEEGLKAADSEKQRESTRGIRSKGMKKGGMVKSSASKRADGIAQRGKTRGKIV
jgi:hypothetical protein